MLPTVVFLIGFTAAFVIVMLSSARFVKRGFEFWPPPSADSWQHGTFRALFRVFFISLLVLSVVDFHPGSMWRYLFGIALLTIGFGFALTWTGFLGWKNAFGEATGLKTKGPFAVSRNPIYVVSILGMVGWAILVNSWFLIALLTLWACLYIAAPFLEEIWMKENYGAEFIDYAADVPRFGSPAALIGLILSQFELKLPPVMIVVVCAGVMYWCAQAIQHERVLATSKRAALGLAAGAIAVAILSAALTAFRRHQTTVNPLDPNQSGSIVTSGIYRYTRNPMYVAMFMALLGWGLFLGQLSAVVGLVLYLVAITRLQIIPEERILAGNFGDAYLHYCDSTGRWVNLGR
ncbi:MAG: methyltransferase family protein [bacterium]